MLDDPKHELMRRSLTGVIKGYIQAGIDRHVIADSLNALAAVVADAPDPRIRVTVEDELLAHSMLLMKQGATKQLVAEKMLMTGATLLAEAVGHETALDLVQEMHGAMRSTNRLARSQH
jgi:hypothetical protein